MECLAALPCFYTCSLLTAAVQYLKRMKVNLIFCFNTVKLSKYNNRNYCNHLPQVRYSDLLETPLQVLYCLKQFLQRPFVYRTERAHLNLISSMNVSFLCNSLCRDFYFLSAISVSKCVGERSPIHIRV